MHLSNNIVCYEQKTDGSDQNQDRSEPINKIRRLGSPGDFIYLKILIYYYIFSFA